MQVSMKKMTQELNEIQNLTLSVKQESLPSTESEREAPEQQQLKPRTTKLLLVDIRKEYYILLNLIIETGFTGIEDNYRIRESLNKLIFEIRKIQDFVIKIKSKNT
jgi:hypothetical protein